MKQNKITAGMAIMVMASMVLSLSCERDCPTCPKPPEPGSYYVYLADYLREYNPVIWVVDSRIDTVIDSIETPSNNITVMDVDADGQYLAIFIPSADTDYVFDCATGQIVARITPGGIPVLTNDGNSVIICNLGGGQPGKYDIATGALISHDTLIYTNYGKSLSRPWIYGTVANYDSVSICIYDYEAMQVVKAFNVQRPDGSIPHVMNMVISNDCDYFYFIIRPDKIFKWEIATDSIVDSLYIYYGAYYGDLACTPDGRYLLATEVTQWPSEAPGSMAVIDLSTFTICRRVVAWGLDSRFPSANFQLGELAVTGDGLKAYTCPSSLNGGLAVSLNLVDWTADAVKGLPENPGIIALAAGRNTTK